tara:strand:- start:18 stop:158 length:141 start_codon:yes stop_codon:yes gene_type:complete
MQRTRLHRLNPTPLQLLLAVMQMAVMQMAVMQVAVHVVLAYQTRGK